MNIVILDLNTLTIGDLDFSSIEKLGKTTYYDVLPQDKIVENCKDADVLLINKAQMTRDIIQKLPKLKYIGLFATGYNNVDLKAASEHNIAVANVPGYSTDAVAQHVFAFILMLSTNIHLYNESVHKGEWIYSSSFSYFHFPICELAGKTIGIVGYGNIAKKVAEIASAFGMKVMIHSHRQYENCPYEQVNKKDLFRFSDYVSLNCPLNDETINFVNKDTLRQMKPTAFLINTSRGGVVDSSALADALNHDLISGAGIDVLPVEPMAKDDPLFTAKNCIITPHIGWAALESRKRCVELVAQNLSCWINGKAVNIVNQ